MLNLKKVLQSAEMGQESAAMEAPMKRPTLTAI